MSTPLRVLVVDDSATVRAAVAAALPAADFDLYEAQDGEEALLRAHMTAPHVILMDVQMPRMSGLEALAALQASEDLCEVPVVMLTQLASATDIAGALAAGAHDYLRKPFEAVELIARVAAAGRTGRLVAELRHLSQQLDRTARTDQLTGLANRREVDRALRDPGSPQLALAMIDIDHFKSVNDTYGHGVGDTVLRMVADRLRRCARGADVIGRWGGEEFVAMLSGADSDAAAAACERLLDAVRAPLELPEGPQRVTISIGVAVRKSSAQTIDALLRLADSALYRAKATGRDRFVFALPEEESAESAAP